MYTISFFGKVKTFLWDLERLPFARKFQGEIFRQMVSMFPFRTENNNEIE